MIVCWWSGGITSAVACKAAIELYGNKQCRVIFIDTYNEHEDTYRFLKDCEHWYGVEIETISQIGDKYKSIQDVWRKYNSLNTANGAICSGELKKVARLNWQKENDYERQVFGFEFDSKEFKRALSLKLNYPEAKPIYPLLMLGMDKQACIDYINAEGIRVPEAYSMGFNNNNCLNTGCIQGGIGYWQKIYKDYPDKYLKMAELEHELTDAKGEPVTMLKDQGKDSIELAKKLGYKRKYMPLFLKEHPDYPEIKTILDKKARAVKPLNDCNGFCGTNELLKENDTRSELNDEQIL